MLRPGDVVTVEIEKPVAGGRMLARHEGRVVLVAGAIPGERVRARVDQVKGQLAFAATTRVERASPDRRPPPGDPSCGGNVFAHIAYDRQLTLKREILSDAFTRLARLALPPAVSVHRSPEQGYRMRARLHAHDGRLGFYRESSHALCRPETTGQLREDTIRTLERLEDRLREHGGRAVAGVELAENRDASERVLLVDLHPGGPEPRAIADSAAPLEGCTGLLVRRAGRTLHAWGDLTVTDRIPVAGREADRVTFRRRVGAFFQANRYLLEPLVNHVLSLVPHGPVVDLYSGCGLFGLAAAAAGRAPVACVEGEPLGAADLKSNAGALGDLVTVHQTSVEAFLATALERADATVIVDPPRTGLSREGVAGISRLRAALLAYVSCDVATLARDAGRLQGAGYSPAQLALFDLFPNTAHIEAVTLFRRNE